jgi:hypothetical protein
MQLLYHTYIYMYMLHRFDKNFNCYIAIDRYLRVVDPEYLVAFEASIDRCRDHEYSHSKIVIIIAIVVIVSHMHPRRAGKAKHGMT